MVNFVTMLRQQQSKFTKLTVKIGTAITDTCFESEPVNEKIKMVGLFKIKNIFNKIFRTCRKNFLKHAIY